MGLEDDFLLEDADDEKTVEFIKNYLPQELKEKFEDDELYYFLDLIDEYYSESGILDAQPDNDGYVNIDLEEVVAYIVKEAKKEYSLKDSRLSGYFFFHPYVFAFRYFLPSKLAALPQNTLYLLSTYFIKYPCGK